MLVLSLRHMDQRELYWTLAECIAWARTRDDEAVKGCADPGLSLEIPDDVLQILEDLRQRCRDGSLRAQGRRWDPLPGALDRVPYDPWSGRAKAPGRDARKRSSNQFLRPSGASSIGPLDRDIRVGL